MPEQRSGLLWAPQHCSGSIGVAGSLFEVDVTTIMLRYGG